MAVAAVAAVVMVVAVAPALELVVVVGVGGAVVLRVAAAGHHTHDTPRLVAPSVPDRTIRVPHLTQSRPEGRTVFAHQRRPRKRAVEGGVAVGVVAAGRGVGVGVGVVAVAGVVAGVAQGPPAVRGRHAPVRFRRCMACGCCWCVPRA